MSTSATLEPDDARRRLRDRAAERGLRVFGSAPEHSRRDSVWWPDPLDPEGFVDTAANLGAQVLLVDEPHVDMIEDWGMAVFALDGILHWYECGLASAVDEEEDEEDKDLATGSLEPTPQARSRKELRVIIEALASDPAYDPWGDSAADVVDRHTAALAPEEREHVVLEATYRYGQLFDKLMRQAKPVARQLLADHDPSWTLWRDDSARLLWVAEHVPDLEPRMVKAVAAQLDDPLRERAFEHYQQVDRAAESAASRVLASLDLETRDRFGFATRNTHRDELVSERVDELCSTLDDYDDLRPRILSKMRSVEEETHAVTRECRFATAARALARRLPSKAAVARELGLSPNTIDRIVAAHPQDVPIDDTDHLRRFINESEETTP